MELRHLRYFIAAAEEQHITRAAERLGIQQPPLSQQIKALETELGTQLFRRLPRGVELTDAGHSFLADAYVILEDLEHATAKAQRAARGIQGNLVVGFTSSSPFHPFLPKALRAFRAMYPRVSLSLEEAGTGTLVDAIASGRMDAAFIRSRVGDVSGVSVHELLQEPMAAALPSNHSKVVKGGKSKRLALSDLRSEPFVLYRGQCAPGIYDTIIEGCRRAGFTPIIEQETPRITSTLSLVAAGLGVSIVPASIENLAMSGIVYSQLKRDPELTAPIRLACRSTEQSQTASNFLAFARKLACS